MTKARQPPGFYFHEKTSLLLGLLLAAPLQAMDLPLSTAAKAYADATKSLTICYPALIRALSRGIGRLADRSDGAVGRAASFSLLHEKLPNWSAVQRGLQEGRCDLIPNVGPSLQALPGMALSRAMLEAESAILYRGDLERATFLVSPSGRQTRCSKRFIPAQPSCP